MDYKLTFKQYLQSKQQLRNAVNFTPKTTNNYIVNKYCALSVNEHINHVKLKPSHKLNIKWLHENINYPTPINVIINQNKYTPKWTNQRFLRWLTKNTTLID